MSSRVYIPGHAISVYPGQKAIAEIPDLGIWFWVYSTGKIMFCYGDIWRSKAEVVTPWGATRKVSYGFLKWTNNPDFASPGLVEADPYELLTI